jgi:peptidoglycan/LPS O-acetylase OafA/YrhL
MLNPTSSHLKLQSDLQGHLSTLDGLRGLAILLVLWHNGALAAKWEAHNFFAKTLLLSANIGWIGVQIFFVLSGFLITGILLKEKGARHQFSNFYARRILRIFPLYYFVLILVLLILPMLGVNSAWGITNKSIEIYFWLFLTNWAIPIEGGGGGFSHFWSLAVEEQFYLVWPFTIIFLNRRPIVVVCISLIVTAAIARVILIAVNPDFAKWAAYEFTFARWDALAIGALLAIIVRDEAYLLWFDGMASKILAVSLIYMLSYIVIFHNFAPVETMLSAFNQTVMAIISAVMLFRGIYQVKAVHFVWQKFLQNDYLKDVGKYSYAIYVVHYPVVIALGPFWKTYTGALLQAYPTVSTIIRVIVASVISYLLARLSWVLIEKPFLLLKRFFKARTEIVTGAEEIR